MPHKLLSEHLPGTGRIEAFSDGVIAIIITIMVLELKAPVEADIHSLSKVWPVFLLYALSFLVVAIMWINHHYVLHIAPRASTALIWSNNFLLFWMSIIPVSTAYLGEHPTYPMAVFTYGAVLTFCSASWTLLRLSVGGQLDAEMKKLNQKAALKNLLSTGLYMAGAIAGFFSIQVSYFVYLLIPATYFLPEKHPAAAHTPPLAEQPPSH